MQILVFRIATLLLPAAFLGVAAPVLASEASLGELAWGLSNIDSALTRQERALGTHERMLSGDPNHSRSIENTHSVDRVLTNAEAHPLRYEGILKMLVSRRRIASSSKLLAARYTLGRASFLRQDYAAALHHYFLFLKLVDAKDPQWAPKVESVVTQLLALPQNAVSKVRIDHLLGNIRGFALNEKLSTDLIVMCVRAALLAQQWELVEAWTTIVRRANIRAETMDLYRAIALYQRGSVDAAREIFSLLIESTDRNAVNSAHAYLAQIATDKGFPHVALKHYAEISQDYSDYFEVARSYADLLGQHEKSDKARQVIEARKADETYDLVFKAWLGIKTQDYPYAGTALETLREKIEDEYREATLAKPGELNPNLEFLASRRNPLAAQINDLFQASKQAQAALSKLRAAHNMWLRRVSDTPWKKVAPYPHATEVFLKEIGERHVSLGHHLVAIIESGDRVASIGDPALAKFALSRTKTLDAKQESKIPVDPDLTRIEDAGARLQSLKNQQVILRSASKPEGQLVALSTDLYARTRLLGLEYKYMEPLSGFPHIRSKIAILRQVLEEQSVVRGPRAPFENRYRAVASRWIRVASEIQHNMDQSNEVRKDLWSAFSKQNQQDLSFQRQQTQALEQLLAKVDKALESQLRTYRTQVEGQYQEAISNLKFWEAKVLERKFSSIEAGIEATVERLRDAQTKLVGIRTR